ncbi:MAG: hypothetical protein ACFFDW_14460 [Candidatus Thorarchaeota archaeon]
MNSKNEIKEKISDILLSPWTSIETKDGNVQITGMKKTDTYNITPSDLEIVVELLKEDEKQRIGAVKILGLFGKYSIPYLKKITQTFSTGSAALQKEILLALKRSNSKESVEEFSSLISADVDYDILFELILYLSEILIDYPIEGMMAILNCVKHKQMWSVIETQLRKSINQSTKEIDQMLKFKEKLEKPPPIGISQEMERKRIVYNITMDNIDKGILKIHEISMNDKDNKSKDAKNLIKKIKKMIK